MDWLMILSLIALLPHLLCVMVQGQLSSCSEYFTYMAKPGITDMLGQIEIPPPSVNDEFYLKVALTTTTESPSQIAQLELARSIQVSLENVLRGRTLLYHVYYRLTHEPIPSLSAIWFNNQRYCPDLHDGNITATIELGHILYPLNEQPLVYNYGPWQQISQPWHRNSSTYRIDNPSYDRLNYDYGLNNECGITSYYTDDTNRLISDGEKILPGQWPWLVAIYSQRTDNESVYDFQCTGSLLTTRHIITAKFLIEKKNGTRSRYTLPESQRTYVSFGLLNSREWHENRTGIINRGIASYTNNYRLMILKLKTAIEYNAFIRPICLWSGSTKLRDIVNITGYIVGWGEDRTRNWWYILFKICFYRNASVSDKHRTFQRYTGEPRMILVSLKEVYEATDKIGKLFTVRLQSLFDEVPCDDGGGIVVFNITTGRYQLRGVASSCTAEWSYLKYIDVAEHISWIRQQISNT